MRMALAALLIAGAAFADNSASPPRLPGEVSIRQNLNAQLPLDLMFRDESGKVVRLRDYFHGKPVLLNFMYYRCPMLCSMVMEGISSTLTELKFDVGKEFEVITVSIDPRDMPREAASKKDKYVKRYGRLGAANGWHFLTGHESAIRALTNAAGDTIPFSKIQWTSSGNGDSGAEPFPAGTFVNGGMQNVGSMSSNTWNESCWTFSYLNNTVPPAGTFTGVVRYTLSTP